jgi:hypothetical protein
MSDLELYARYFPAGKKIGVGIPLQNTEVFKDWAIILDIEEDLISLQLSRDVLPVEVSLHYGHILELRGGNENSGYCCRAIVVSEGDSSVLLLRLIGEIVSDELREFYRIDAFLPIRYFVSHEQHIDKLHAEWEERRQQRHLLEYEQKDQKWPDRPIAVGAELPKERISTTHEHVEESTSSDIHENDETAEVWDTIIPLAANISGGGLRVITHQEFVDGEYVLMEIMVPQPRRIIDVIGRVVFANRNYAGGSEHAFDNTGIQYVYIDERDRDAIVTYISTIQLKRIRQLRERYLYRAGAGDGDEADGTKVYSFKSRLKQIATGLLLLTFTLLLVDYFWRYGHDRPKGEIERIFDEGIQRYVEQMGKKP